MTAEFDLVAAADKNGGLGFKGSIPWHLPGDLKFLKTLTTATREAGKRNAVLMGRVTWETIPEKYRPLPKRLNVVISRNRDYQLPAGVLLAHSLPAAVTMAFAAEGVETLFVLGGAQIYQAAIKLPNCRRIYLTCLSRGYRCDAFFPSIDESVFQLVAVSRTHEHKNLRYVFQTWERKR